MELSEEQKKKILDNCEKMNLLNLTRIIFNDETLDGRSNEGRLVKEFLANQNKVVKTTKHEKMPLAELTEENKKFIQQAVAAQNSRPIEI